MIQADRQNMLRITAITLGKSTPASRFRIRQYIPNLMLNEILVKEYPSLIPYDAKIPVKIRMRYLGPISLAWQICKILGTAPAAIASHFSDLVWLNRGMAGGYNIGEKFLKKPVFFDIDDALWIGNPNIYKLALQSEAIIAGNSFIADWFSKYNKNISVVPTAIDTERFVPNKADGNSEKFIIGWTGSADGLKFLFEIEEELRLFIRDHKNSYLKIICDKKPGFASIPSDKIIYEPWNPLTENILLRDMSVGIMPLTDNDWSRGKCSFKMLQYMSTGIPVVVSDIGMNSEILSKSEVGYGVKKSDEWQFALTELWNNYSLREKMGENGRALIEKEYSVDVVAKQLSDIFKTGMKLNY
jgi:glycosyltransferase involved in cell wall biosynthesis